jgi:hypothetical protein
VKNNAKYFNEGIEKNLKDSQAVSQICSPFETNFERLSSSVSDM